MIEIYLVRHGHSKANEVNMIGGDYPLSIRGESQIRSAQRKYDGIQFDRVYSSDLKRSRQTAEQLFGRTISEDELLPEFNSFWFGNAEERIRQEDGYVVGIRTSFDGDFTSFMRECRGDDPFRRADKAIEKMKELANKMSDQPEKFPNKRIAIISSDTLMRSIVQQLRDRNMWDHLSGKGGLPGIKNLQYVKFSFDNGSIVDVDMPPVQ